MGIGVDRQTGGKPATVEVGEREGKGRKKDKEREKVVIRVTRKRFLAKSHHQYNKYYPLANNPLTGLNIRRLSP